jgi:hypothetical protein
MVSPTAEPSAGAGTLSVRDAPQVAARPAPAAPSGRGPRRSRRDRERWATRAVVAAAALGGLLTEVAPSGTAWADRVMTAGFVAVLAAAGSSAKRWTWIVSSAAALVLAGSWVAVVWALAALAVTLASAGPVRPPPAVGAAVGGLAGLTLLRATGPAFHGSSALLVAAAVTPLLASGYRYSGTRSRRWARASAAALGLGAVVAGAGYAYAAASARPRAERGIELLQRGMAAARDGDDERATARLAAAADSFAEADRQLGSWYAAPAQVLPVVGHNVRAAETMATSAAEVAQDGTDAAVEADLDTLTVQGGRLDVDRVSALSKPVDSVASVLASADAELAAVDDDWLLDPVDERLDRVQREVATARTDVDLAAEATRVIPGIFGAGGTSRWFVAFVTPVEARGRTGLVGNFAELTATDGDVEMTRFGRVSELESEGTPGPERTLSGPDDYLERWARFAPAETWRNVTMSPEFPSVGQVMTELYPQSGGRPVDGVIAVDPAGLAALMEFTGPVEVPGIAGPLTPARAAEFLLRDQYVTLDGNAERIDTLETLARATFERLTTVDLPSPRRVADRLGDVVRAGHLHAYGADPRQQALFERVGLDGALPEVDGDSFGVVANNAVGNKVDLFLQRAIAYRATWDPDSGELAVRATVRLRNGAPRRGLPDYLIGSPLPAAERPPAGTNRTFLSIYSPWTLERARLDGEDVGIERQSEAGRYAYSLFLDVPPNGGTRTVTLDLRGDLPSGDGYSLDVTTQPLVHPDQLNLRVDVGGDETVRADAPLLLHGRRASVREPLTQQEESYRVEIGP